MTLGTYVRQADADASWRRQRADRGLRAWQSGMAAERSVAACYDRRGADLMETRWRGEGGEIDLILREDAVIVFCEVKAARSFDEAIARLRPAQVRRIHAAAAEYLGHVPAGQLAEVRFDLAVVDQCGATQIIENAFGHF